MSNGLWLRLLTLARRRRERVRAERAGEGRRGATGRHALQAGSTEPALTLPTLRPFDDRSGRSLPPPERLSKGAGEGFRTTATVLALAFALSGCGAVNFDRLFGDGKTKQPAAARSGQAASGILTGTVEGDGAISSANVRVELFEVTGQDPDEVVAKMQAMMVARTGRDGRYTFNLGGLARAPQGQTKSWLIRAGGAAADNPKGPDATVTFSSASARGRLPPLYLWDGQARVDAADEQVTFRFAPLPGGRRVDPTVYGVELAGANGAGGFVPPVGGAPEVPLPRLVLQELPWTYRPLATLDHNQTDGTVFHGIYRGGARTIQGVNPPPISRERNARLVPPGLGFRGLTDGKPDNVLPHAMPPGGRVEIDLGTAAEVARVYLFGLQVAGDDQVTAHLSGNANQPGPALVQVSARDAFEIRLPPGARGRHLFVRFAGQLLALGEIVAYGPLEQKWEAARPVAPFSNQVQSAPVN